MFHDTPPGWASKVVTGSQQPTAHKAAQDCSFTREQSPMERSRSCGTKERAEREIPEKTCRPAASSDTIPTCDKSGSDSTGNRTRFAVVGDYLPPTKARRVRFPVGSHPDFRMWESCRTMTLVSGFSRGSPASPALEFRRCSWDIAEAGTCVMDQEVGVDRHDVTGAAGGIVHLSPRHP
ncbi:hypothetical protein PR048_013770 [Dryococelus australis]|uniref:Uncharacterized protein n=1 Tax=Dryococelus australis TaxID=614101 RepID=A0ABQ9HT49_9NEOP|nr:hypothetical protein PR048_013770 [Dryococelus australis]